MALVLLAGACSKEAELAPQVAGASPEEKLTWGGTNEIAGTPVMRIDLVGSGGKGMSSSYGETRNVLFLDPAEKAGRWLLPDRGHFFAESIQLASDLEHPTGKGALGTAVLVKDVGHNDEGATGRLLLFDPVGRTVEWLSEGVRRLNAASVEPSGDWVILYERNRQFVIAVVDGKTLKMRREQAFDIPALK
jgi:hypothetical protein